MPATAGPRWERWCRRPYHARKRLIGAHIDDRSGRSGHAISGSRSCGFAIRGGSCIVRRGARHERLRRPYICPMDPTRTERLSSEDQSPSVRASGPATLPPRASAWRPFRHPDFTVIWTASLAANIGTWMYTAASSWLMTSLSPDPLIVSLVQVAASLPIVLLAIPAGALADIIDRRRFLIIGEAANTAIAAVFAVLVSLDLVTAAVLLLFTFLISAFGAFTAPAWQAVTPQLVPKEDLLPRSRRTASASTSAGRSDRRLEAHSRPRSASRRRSGSMRRAISASMGD